MDFLHARGVHVGVDLRRGDVGVSEHFLNLAQISSARHQMSRETVSQRVRADRVSRLRAICLR